MRMKAKGFLLSVILILSSFCFFACKETDVKVESIAFMEQSIELLVGEEYSPQIKILPSYATNRSYTLISSDETALQVNGGTIKALKVGSGSVELKVVSNENEQINDVISVTIYNEAEELDMPTNFAFDGGKFTFNAVDYVSTYALNVNGVEINIGNNTEYLFDNLAEKFANGLTNELIECSVKAVGDGRIHKDSQYSESIKFVKVGQVQDVYVENKTLYLNALPNVAEYSVNVYNGSTLSFEATINNPTYTEGQLSLDLSALSNNVKSGEYTISVNATGNNYNVIDAQVYVSAADTIVYKVVGKVTNVSMNNYMLSWDVVNNAEFYEVKLYNQETLIETFENVEENYLKLELNESGAYWCEVLAKTTKTINVGASQEYSTRLDFELLSAPNATIANNLVTWNAVTGAEGYLLDVCTSSGDVIVSQKFVTSLALDVSEYPANNYVIKLASCGNNKHILSSTQSQYQWTILKQISSLKIEDKKLYWNDLDEKSSHKYQLILNTSETENVNLVLQAGTSGFTFDSATNQACYDLSSYTFEVGNHDVSVQSIGAGNIFDSKASQIQLIKLPDSSITSLNGGVFAFNVIANASRYEFKIYSSSDTTYSNPIIESAATGGNYILDTSVLNTGSYNARIFVYGNNANVLDADNRGDTTFAFKKLSVPTMSVDSTNMVIKVSQDVVDAVSYKLFENGKEVALQEGQYNINSLRAGNYTYTAQAIGNGQEIINGNVTAAGEEIKIKKLSNPTIKFDNKALTYTISCSDQALVQKYKFLLNGNELTVTNGQVDASSFMTTEGTYTVKLAAEPIVSSDYDLIIGSDQIEYVVTKLAGECSAQMDGGNLVITPNSTLSSGSYTLKLRIVNSKGDELVVDKIQYTNSKFLVPIYNEKYEVVGLKNDGGVQFFADAGEYFLYTTISKAEESTVSSNEIACNSVAVLEEVTSITRSGQNIKFNSVSNAGGYIVRVKLGNKEWYVDISKNYTEGSPNTLAMEDFQSLMTQAGVTYQAGSLYNIVFVSLASNNQQVSNKGTSAYSFEFLEAPTITITETENKQYLSITNNIVNASRYKLEFIQSETTKPLNIIKDGEVNNYDLANLSEFGAGNIEIKVKSVADSGDYFESKYSKCNAVKLASPNVKIINGVISWDVIANAKQYNLHYVKFGEDKVVTLYNGVEGFSISGGTCSYIFDDLETGLVEMYLQVDSVLETGGNFYLHANAGEHFINIYKLSQPTISVVNGEVRIEIANTDLALVNNIELLLDGQPIQMDILTATEDIIVSDTGTKTQTTINPNILLRYVSTTAFTSERLSIRLYSVDGKTINSSYSEKDIYGLLAPQNLDVTTSTTIIDGSSTINEVIEKLSWVNPSVNGGNVTKYEVIINYLEEDYKFESDTNLFMMPKYYDANSNGNFDEGEVKFGAGVYTIKVKALTSDNNNVVHSKYSESISITILATPTNLATSEGDIIWEGDLNTESYLIRVYLLDGDNRELIVSSETKSTQFDMCKLEPFVTGVYGVTVQAMHSSSKILTSEESNMFEVVRLPQAKGYFVDDGIFYIKVHGFFNTAIVTLTDSATNTTKLTFEMPNTQLSLYENYIATIDNWKDSLILTSYTMDEAYLKVPYVSNYDYTLRQALAEGYEVSIKLIGNSCNTKGAIISGHTLVNASNLNYDDNELIKLATPTVVVSDTVRGQFELRLNESIQYSALQYYVDAESGTSLQGVHLYSVNVSADKTYNILVAEIIDEEKFNKCATIQKDETKNNLEYFIYDDKCFNIVKDLNFNFSTDYYYYYTPNGEYNSIKLSDGGSFVVNARLLGDDTHFVQSNISESAIVKRYSILNMSIQDGELTWANQADAFDEPIYIITLNDSTGNQYELVLYNSIKYTESQIKALVEVDASKNYIYDIIDYSLNDEFIKYDGLAEIAEKYFGGEGSTLTANIMTYFTDNTDNNKLLAQSTIAKTITVLPINDLNVDNGLLKWNLSYVEKTGGGEYINRYEFVIYNEQGIELYSTILTDSDYSVKEHVANYELPIGYAGFSFVANTNYKFSIRALAGDSTTYANSILANSSSVKLLPTISDLSMNNGLLTWTNPTVNSVEVHVSYQLEDGTAIVYTTTTNGNSFDLPRQPVLDSNGTTRDFIAGCNYDIKVRLRGNSATLNGFYSEPITTQRLVGVKEDSIATDSGVLTWEHVGDGVTYVLTYTLSNGQKSSVEVNSNSYDFAGLLEGEISVNIYARHKDYFSSFNSADKTFYKLSAPVGMEFVEETTIITWDKVLDNNGVEINDYKVSVKVGVDSAREYICTTNSWSITGVGSNEFSIAISAISTATNGTLINSEFSQYVQMIQPEAVDVSTFIYNDKSQRFELKAIDNEQAGDQYYIGYNYYEVGSEGYIGQEFEITTSETTEDGKYYYYYPSVIGTYRQVYVRVVRAKSLASNNTYWVNESGENHTLEFSLFGDGDGSEQNPYLIYSEEHLRNIKYFLDANYQILSSITLTSGDPITNGDVEFTGSITTVGECYIYNYTVGGSQQLLPQIYVGLFSRANGAVFTNIKISQLRINGYVNSTNLYIGGLVAYAQNCTFNQVQITDSVIKVFKNAESGEIGYIGSDTNIYIGGIAGNAADCSLNNCTVKLTGATQQDSSEIDAQRNVYLALEGNPNTTAYVGGLVGRAINGSYLNNECTFDIRHSLTKTAYDYETPKVYIGALIGTANNASINTNTGSYDLYNREGESTEYTNQTGKS